MLEEGGGGGGGGAAPHVSLYSVYSTWLPSHIQILSPQGFGPPSDFTGLYLYSPSVFSLSFW